MVQPHYFPIQTTWSSYAISAALLHPYLVAIVSDPGDGDEIKTMETVRFRRVRRVRILGFFLGPIIEVKRWPLRKLEWVRCSKRRGFTLKFSGSKKR